MKVRCIYNTGEALRPHEYKPLEKRMMGRFGVTGCSEYNGLKIGKEYLVMGIIIFETYQAYLIDYGFISACPCQLFEIVDEKVNTNWHFRLIDKNEDIYPFIQAIFGYPELCSDRKAYENLIVEMEEYAEQIYFRHKEKEILLEFYSRFGKSITHQDTQVAVIQYANTDDLFEILAKLQYVISGGKIYKKTSDGNYEFITTHSDYKGNNSLASIEEARFFLKLFEDEKDILFISFDLVKANS